MAKRCKKNGGSSGAEDGVCMGEVLELSSWLSLPVLILNELWGLWYWLCGTITNKYRSKDDDLSSCKLQLVTLNSIFF